MLVTAKMNYQKSSVVLALLAALTLVFYLEARPQTQPAPAQQQEAPPPLSVPKSYQYQSRGRRDPFVNPIPKPPPPKQTPAAAAPAPVVRPPGLPGVLIAEAGIAGVVTSKEPSMNVVIITAPGGRTYFARAGDRLFDGVVKEIRLDTVIFTVTNPGGDSPRTPREIVRQVRPTSGDKK
jgi:hypothetical protein